MKQFTVFTGILSVGVLAVWAFTQFASAPTSSRAMTNNSAPVPVYDATGEMLKHTGEQLAVPVTGANVQIAPVYDATGEMLKHIGNQPAVTATGADVQIAPVYDATGEMLKHIGK